MIIEINRKGELFMEEPAIKTIEDCVVGDLHLRRVLVENAFLNCRRRN